MKFEIDKSDPNNCLLKTTNNISEIDVKDLGYNEFFNKYLLSNIPCVIKCITQSWEATRFWMKDNELNFDYLSAKYGASEVTVYNCSKRYYNSQQTEGSTFEKYLNYWKQSKLNNDTSIYYLKDWHLKLRHTDDNFYEVPLFFASDWLNEYYTANLNDDYRFVYMGLKHTWTPFHVDVFSSYSWSANVCGRKRWVLFPPGEEKYLLDHLGNLPYDVTKLSHRRKCYEVIQNPGDAIFVPSGWHHQVWNLDDAISVNHNWINGCNIKTMWNAMNKCLDSVCKEIEDCKAMDNFEEHCQVMLNSVFGMDYYKFYEFLKFIAVSRISMIKRSKSKVLFHGHTIGVNHILFDLNAIRAILELFSKSDYLDCLECFKNMDLQPVILLEQIEKLLETL